MLACGIVGMPNVGKSTLFNALGRAAAEVSSYPFCTIDANVAVTPVPDERLARLAEVFDQARAIPASIEFVDIAGLVRGASKGQGLGNRFLAHVRETDCILHLVRCFENPQVAHVDGLVDPIRDIETINLELMLADLDTIEGRLHRLKPGKDKSRADVAREQALLEALRDALQEGQPARAVHIRDDDMPLLCDLFLLTAKRVLYVANIGEADLASPGPYLEALRDWAERRAETVVAVPARLEADLVEFSPEDAALFAAELGIREPSLARVVRTVYELLGLVSFFTGVGREVRAWAVPRGTHAPDAAGKVHTDMQQGFIKAEVIPFSRLSEAGSWQRAREAGLVRAEGHDYVVQDGDVIQFRFSH